MQASGRVSIKMASLFACGYFCVAAALLSPATRTRRNTNNTSTTPNSNIAFDLPDLTTIVETPDGRGYQLDAYRTTQNDRILMDIRDSSGRLHQAWRISRLSWVSIGHPMLVESAPRNSRRATELKLFHFTPSGFYTAVQTLTSHHRQLLAAVATEVHNVNVTQRQIAYLPLTTFECTTMLRDDTDKPHLLKGTINSFRPFPHIMEFYAPENSIERRLFTKALEDDDNADLQFQCHLSAMGKLVATNTLTITGARLQQLGLEEEIFGPVGNSSANFVYVMRHQMASLASEMYSTLNIVEEYEMPETKFAEAFVDELIRQVAERSFSMVPIDEALSSLSKYTYDATGDMKADEIKRDLGEILVVEKTGNKSHIVNNKSRLAKNDNSDSSSISGSLSANFLFVTASAAFNYGHTNSHNSHEETKSLDDQLSDLNRESSNHVKWEIEGNKVVPKWLNVAKLQRSKMSSELRFNRIRRQIFSAPFNQLIELNVPTSRYDRLTGFVHC
jgi:hypothetical protein